MTGSSKRLAITNIHYNLFRFYFIRAYNLVWRTTSDKKQIGVKWQIVNRK